MSHRPSDSTRSASGRRMSRRQALQLLAAAAPAAAMPRLLAQSGSSGAAGPDQIDVTAGPYTNTRESLAAYRIPDWFADAKFGIWAHWGPQSAVGDGDWYARNMYMEGSSQYEYHLKRFGPQSKVGYKDLIPLYTADKWDPEHLMDLYQKAGAKYFFSMGVHHDGYDLWDSKYQPHWNSVATGPHQDVVGRWAAAARKRGMRFGVSEHLSNAFDWFATSHLADKKGPYAGVPYDGQNPAYASLYHDYSGMGPDFIEKVLPHPMGRMAPDSWKLQYFHRVKDLLDQHQPDLLYTDGGIEFGAYGLGTVAEEYNVGPLDPHGKSEAIYFSKVLTDCSVGTCVIDRERQVTDGIDTKPWQTDTCIGDWHYKEGITYKTPKKVIDLLVDIVSKNGNLLLNFPLPASGELDPKEREILASITDWMSVNGEAIFATRPWTLYGEGPATKVVIPTNGQQFDPNESKKPDLGLSDVRYTTKGKTMYALVMGWPAAGASREITLQALGSSSPQRPARVVDVRLLGRDEPMKFTQQPDGLRVTLPETPQAAANIGCALRMRFV